MLSVAAIRSHQNWRVLEVVDAAILEIQEVALVDSLFSLCLKVQVTGETCCTYVTEEEAGRGPLADGRAEIQMEQLTCLS